MQADSALPRRRDGPGGGRGNAESANRAGGHQVKADGRNLLSRSFRAQTFVEVGDSVEVGNTLCIVSHEADNEIGVNKASSSRCSPRTGNPWSSASRSS
jgi:hypothetical protein